MRQYLSGLFTSIFLCIGFILFFAAKNDNLGDITVNSIKVLDNGSGGFISTYDINGKLTSYIGPEDRGGGKIAVYDKNNVQLTIQGLADVYTKQNKELLNRIRENEIRTISRENDIYEAQELIAENNDLIFSNYDELSAEIDERIELFRKKLEEREDIIKSTVKKISEFEDDIMDSKHMIVENTQEIHQAFEAIMENTEVLRHTKETLTKRLMELYGPY